MSDQLNELKTILNSLIIPYPEGLTLRQLCYDYQDLEGQAIPYKEVGFTSLTALLKSMRDMIRMVGNLQDISTVVLYPVRSETTSHIIDLVQKQNKGRKKTRRTPISRFSTWNRPIATHRPLSNSVNTFRTNLYHANTSHLTRSLVTPAPSWRPLTTTTNNGYTPRTVIDHSKEDHSKSSAMNSLSEKFLNFRITKTLNKLNEQQSKPVQTSHSATDLNALTINGFSSNTLVTPSKSPNVESIPNKLKDNIKLMMSSPDIEEGFMLFNFEARYRHQFKEPFNYKSYGFETLTDCLTSLPDVLKLIPTGTKTYKLMPLKNNTSKSKSGSVPTTTCESVVITNGNSITVITSTPTSTTLTFVTTNSTTMTNTTISTTYKKLFTISSKPPISETLESAICSTTTDQFNPALKSAISQVPEQVMCPTISPKPKAEKCLDNQSVCSSASNDSNIINNRAKQNFRTILLFQENGINALDFPSEYEKHFKVKFDSRIWGFKSAMELFYGLSQIFAIEVNEKNEKILHDSRFKKFEKPKTTNKTDLNSEIRKFLLRKVPDTILAKILRLIEMRSPLGLPVSDFVKIYGQTYEPIEQTLRQLRFSDAFQLFEVIKDELPIVNKTIDGQTQAFIRSKQELSEWTVRQTRASKFIIPITLVETPVNVVLPGEHFQPIQLPERFKAGNYEYVAVYISSSVNPHEIYIQFKGADYHTSLESLMFSLDFYEKANEEQWTVPFEFLYVGYPVVCRYPGDRNWHRARISRIHASDKRVVTVSFVDYGGTHVLDFKNLRLMKKEFLSLPVQALKVGLYGIKPIMGTKPCDWTASARDKLLRFSKPQYALACTLLEVRPDNHWVAICDTNSTVDVFLHLVLVNDKHALLSDDSDNDSANDNPTHNRSENNYPNRPIAQTNGF